MLQPSPRPSLINYLRNGGVMKTIDWIKQFSKENNLKYIEFENMNTTHYRVKNGSKFVDFWPNGSFRDVNGEYHRRGSAQRGYGADNLGCYEIGDDDGCGFLEGIVEEIKKLIISEMEVKNVSNKTRLAKTNDVNY